MSRLGIAGAVLGLVLVVSPATGADEPGADRPGPATRRLVDGLPVYVQSGPAPWIHLRAYIRAGRAAAPPGQGDLADLCAAWMLAGGSESLPAADFDAASDALGARIELTADRDLLVADLAVDAERLHPAARLFADLLMYPAFEPSREQAARAGVGELPVQTDAAASELRTWLELGPAIAARSGKRARRADVVAFHRDRVGADTTVLVLGGPLEGIDIEREVRAAFLGFRHAASPQPLPRTHPASGRRASVAAHGVRPGVARLLVGRTGLVRTDPDWLPVLTAELALESDAAGVRLEQAIDEPDLLWLETTVPSARAELLAHRHEERFRDALEGRITPAGFERARTLIERAILPPPEAPDAGLKHALLEALGVPGEDPAIRIRNLRALDRPSVARALAAHVAGP